MTPDILILGAGMAGLATAYHLTVKHNLKNVVVVDERPPLGLTSSRGTMAYRNWFPGPGDAMVRLTNRSIDLLQEIDRESNHAIRLTQNGYMYLTAEPHQIEIWRDIGRDGEERGVGKFREHQDASEYLASPISQLSRAPDGVDLLTDGDGLRRLYPGITDDAIAMLHVRRAGAFDVFALADWLVERAREHGAKFIRARLDKISVKGNRVECIGLSSGQTISTRTLVIAAGPLLPEVAGMLELRLPVYGELHAKITLDDTARVFPRYGDLMYWNDAQTLEWTQAERAALSDGDETQSLLDEFRGGVHFLPKGSAALPKIMGLWTYDIHEAPYQPEPSYNPYYAEIVLRGLARMIPAARVYFDHGADAVVDGGYYCKTRENRPLIGPLPIQGAYVIGALSGYGVMASLAAADLLSTHILGGTLPDYAPSFMLSRYEDPEYQKLLQDWEPRSGQL